MLKEFYSMSQPTVTKKPMFFRFQYELEVNFDQYFIFHLFQFVFDSVLSLFIFQNKHTNIKHIPLTITFFPSESALKVAAWTGNNSLTPFAINLVTVLGEIAKFFKSFGDSAFGVAIVSVCVFFFKKKEIK